jgi:hypothetical protein
MDHFWRQRNLQESLTKDPQSWQWPPQVWRLVVVVPNERQEHGLQRLAAAVAKEQLQLPVSEQYWQSPELQVAVVTHRAAFVKRMSLH